MKIRVGFGFDVHPLEEGRELWLGGVKLPAMKGAAGHSDADVLIHALCDAILGAANLGDIGSHFSNTDPRWAGMDSKYFLQEVTRMIQAKGWKIMNADLTVTLETPKVRPHIDAMKQAMAPLMGISMDDVSIKATTNERLGYVGRMEGLNAYAVVLIVQE